MSPLLALVVTLLGSTLAIRGAPGDVLIHGDADASFGQTFGHALTANSATVAVSGISFDANDVGLFGGSTLLLPAAEPYLEVIGQDPSSRILRVAGPVGAPGLLLAALQPGYFDPPGYAAPLWLDFTALPIVLPVTTQGQAAPVDLPIAVPAGLAGVILRVAAVFPGILDALEPGKVFVANPAALVVRF